MFIFHKITLKYDIYVYHSENVKCKNETVKVNKNNKIIFLKFKCVISIKPFGSCIKCLIFYF